MTNKPTKEEKTRARKIVQTLIEKWRFPDKEFDIPQLADESPMVINEIDNIWIASQKQLARLLNPAPKPVSRKRQAANGTASEPIAYYDVNTDNLRRSGKDGRNGT